MTEERWAVVLGCSAGAGAAICRSLARDPGLHVFGAHRGNHPDAAEAVAADVRAAGRRVHLHVGEAGKAEVIPDLADELLAVAGPRSVHILVHSLANASVGSLVATEPFLHPKQIQKTFECMAHSFLYWTQELVRRDLLAPGARILALDNAINESVLAHLGAIAAAKAALESYVRYLAWDLRDRDVHVNALKFGTVETVALQAIFPGATWDAAKALHDRMFPAGRMASLEEVAAFVSVLAGPSGAWFNSAIIDFTGGQMHALYQQLMDKLAQEQGA